MAQKQRKSLDLASIKKKLEDYEQLLQDYTLMRRKKKMKDSKVQSKEWWEVAKEYFTKELENNIAQHKVDERILRYKIHHLEIEPQTKLVGEDIIIVKPQVDIEPLILVQVEIKEP